MKKRQNVETKMKKCQNVGTKSAFTPKIYKENVREIDSC